MTTPARIKCAHTQAHTGTPGHTHTGRHTKIHWCTRSGAHTLLCTCILARKSTHTLARTHLQCTCTGAHTHTQAQAHMHTGSNTHKDLEQQHCIGCEQWQRRRVGGSLGNCSAPSQSNVQITSGVGTLTELPPHLDWTHYFSRTPVLHTSHSPRCAPIVCFCSPLPSFSYLKLFERFPQ
jgi:hypothetical protein